MSTNKVSIKRLVPTDSHKSFYGKALVIDDGDGTLHLKSYNTIVASYKDGKLIRHWYGWSATTGRHIAAFCDLCGIARVNKAAWCEMEVC